jgi:hypothetical protein
MDNPQYMERITDTAAAMDYKTISNILRETVDSKYTQSHIMSDGILRLILAELEYWHNLAERLLKEKGSAIQNSKQ